MSLDDMDESTADAILDWIDADNVPRELGAESDYYSGLDPPVRPRNAVPPSLDELLLVRGVTREKLFGLDLNANFDTDDWEADLASADPRRQLHATQQPRPAAMRSPWCRCLTVYSGERDESFEGRTRILLNQSDLGALHRELSTVLEPSWANFIVAYRQYGPYSGSEAGTDASSLVGGSLATAAAQHPVSAGTGRGARGDSHWRDRTRKRSLRAPSRTIQGRCATTCRS